MGRLFAIVPIGRRSMLKWGQVQYLPPTCFLGKNLPSFCKSIRVLMHTWKEQNASGCCCVDESLLGPILTASLSPYSRILCTPRICYSSAFPFFPFALLGTCRRGSLTHCATSVTLCASSHSPKSLISPTHTRTNT